MATTTPGILAQVTERSSPRHHSTTEGDGKLDRILGDLAEHPEFGDDIDELRARLLASTKDWGHSQLLDIIVGVCDLLGIDRRDLTYQNVRQWRVKAWAANR